MDYYVAFKKFIESSMDILYEIDGMKHDVAIPSSTQEDSVPLSFNQPSSTHVDHRSSLLMLYFYISTITILILRDSYNHWKYVVRPNVQTRRWIFSTFSLITACIAYYSSTLPYEHIFYNKLFLCAAAHISLLVIHIPFGYWRPDVFLGIMISHFGTLLGFISLASEYSFGECGMFYAIYKVGLYLYQLGYLISVYIIIYIR